MMPWSSSLVRRHLKSFFQNPRHDELEKLKCLVTDRLHGPILLHEEAPPVARTGVGHHDLKPLHIALRSFKGIDEMDHGCSHCSWAQGPLEKPEHRRKK